MSDKIKQHGFTLLELLVTIGIIVLVSAIALPTIHTFMTSGADASAYNQIAAQLSTARAIAIESGTYAGVHFQLDDKSSLVKRRQYSAIVSYDPQTQQFSVVNGYEPRKMPGTMAVGQITDNFIIGTSNQYQDMDNTVFPKFCNFTVVFSSEGSVVVNVPNASHDNEIFFADDGPFRTFTDVISGDTKDALWDRDDANYNGDATYRPLGVSVLTLFDFSELAPRDDEKRADYLDENGQFLPINVHTGQLYNRK